MNVWIINLLFNKKGLKYLGNFKLFSLFLVGFLSFQFITYSQTNLNKYYSFIRHYHNVKNVPSISAGLVHDGKIIWTGNIGYSDLENEIPVSTKSVYRLASISKMITAISIMQLVERGRLSLEDDIRKYVPFYPQKKWKITIRHLLNHTSGIRNYYTHEFDSKTNFASNKDVILYLANDSLLFEPGTKYLYTSLSYNLLAAAIENISGQSFYDYLEENIFKISGMSNTYLDYYNHLIPNRVRGYVRNSYRKLENAPLADLTIKFAGGGLLSSIDDLLKFSIAVMNNKLIKSSTLDSMLVPTRLKNGEQKNYGLGIALGEDTQKRKYFGHSGGGTGFVSQLTIFPEEKVAVVHLINLKDRGLNNPAGTIASIFFEDDFELPKKSLCDALMKIALDSNIDSVFTIYSLLRDDSTNIYDITKEELKIFGYDLLNIKKIREAIITFNHLIEEYPDFVDGYIGLADTYFKDGNKGLAIKNFRLALKLNPKSDYSIRMIDKIDKMK